MKKKILFYGDFFKDMHAQIQVLYNMVGDTK